LFFKAKSNLLVLPQTFRPEDINADGVESSDEAAMDSSSSDIDLPSTTAALTNSSTHASISLLVVTFIAMFM